MFGKDTDRKIVVLIGPAALFNTGITSAGVFKIDGEMALPK